MAATMPFRRILCHERLQSALFGLTDCSYAGWAMRHERRAPTRLPRRVPTKSHGRCRPRRCWACLVSTRLTLDALPWRRVWGAFTLTFPQSSGTLHLSPWTSSILTTIMQHHLASKEIDLSGSCESVSRPNDSLVNSGRHMTDRPI
ncbi:hypothetical protein BS50DRAFT_152165 [Corynespora cassiicola Philippines]|uniref:Uncharacterized protein n=1 Tax=Corynespora cassiicola Philippines TaxID=1448308 RepID=A0A2T2N7V5_CORCC|nr:hypothetical protein BS50DRAFT_152165 [Corynespora cassiicola Philippines]